MQSEAATKIESGRTGAASAAVRSALKVAISAAVVAVTLPAVAIAMLAMRHHWIEAEDPGRWAAWVQVFTAMVTMLLTAGYFLVTAMLFHSTSRQADYAAEQAASAASTAKVAVEEARLQHRALLMTIATQRLQQRSLVLPLRNAVSDRIQTIEKLISQLETNPAEAGFEGDEFKQLWDRLIEAELEKVWLVPDDVRADFLDAREGLKKLQSELDILPSVRGDVESLTEKYFEDLLDGARATRAILARIATRTEDVLTDAHEN
jgi:hypothetical protein